MEVTPSTIAVSRVRLSDAKTLIDGYEIEIHKKFALAVACFVFVMLGAPIALRFPRGGVGLTLGVSLFVFAAIVIFSVLGPFFSPHGYDQVYGSYVKVPPSLSPYPKHATLEEAMKRAASQARLQVQSFETSGTQFTATLTSSRAIDPRATRYVDRIDEFRNTKVTDIRDDGRTVVRS